MTPDDLYASIPTIQPKNNLLDIAVPGIGKYNLEAHRTENKPVMTQENWCKLCIGVAEKNMAASPDDKGSGFRV